MTRLSATETFSTEGPQCPHCGVRMTADEGFYYDENRYVEDECHECEKKFSVRVYTSTTWTCTVLPPAAPNDETANGEQR
jgi:transposase-like protein